MARQPNRYYNSPWIRDAAQNLSSAIYGDPRDELIREQVMNAQQSRDFAQQDRELATKKRGYTESLAGALTEEAGAPAWAGDAILSGNHNLYTQDASRRNNAIAAENLGARRVAALQEQRGYDEGIDKRDRMRDLDDEKFSVMTDIWNRSLETDALHEQRGYDEGIANQEREQSLADDQSALMGEGRQAAEKFHYDKMLQEIRNAGSLATKNAGGRGRSGADLADVLKWKDVASSRDLYGGRVDRLELPPEQGQQMMYDLLQGVQAGQNPEESWMDLQRGLTGETGDEGGWFGIGSKDSTAAYETPGQLDPAPGDLDLAPSRLPRPQAFPTSSEYSDVEIKRLMNIYNSQMVSTEVKAEIAKELGL